MGSGSVFQGCFLQLFCFHLRTPPYSINRAITLFFLAALFLIAFFAPSQFAAVLLPTDLPVTRSVRARLCVTSFLHTYPPLAQTVLMVVVVQTSFNQHIFVLFIPTGTRISARCLASCADPRNAWEQVQAVAFVLYTRYSQMCVMISLTNSFN